MMSEENDSFLSGLQHPMTTRNLRDKQFTRSDQKGMLEQRYYSPVKKLNMFGPATARAGFSGGGAG